uniref:Secreted protein n=1 Tax=Steinernema glaseri TaxID=37863 RepID=A0A1I7ZAT8_9BILA
MPPHQRPKGAGIIVFGCIYPSTLYLTCFVFISGALLPPHSTPSARTMKFSQSSSGSSTLSAFVGVLMALLLCNAVSAANVHVPLSAFVDKPISHEGIPVAAFNEFPWAVQPRPYAAYGKRSHQVELRSMSQFKNCYFSPIQCVLMERRRR